MRFRYVAAPHPHLAVDEIIAPHAYASLRFPDQLIGAGQAWGLTATDPQYAFEDPAWRAVRDELCSELFVMSVLREFSGDMSRAGCRVDPTRARLVPFVETREEKELSTLPGNWNPNELFTRLDFQSKGAGTYREFIHLDWARRIVGGILFFSDADEEGLDGGELAFYRDRDFRDDRWCHDAELVAQFRPRANTGIIFLNWNGAFHGPRAIKRLRGRRRWLYYTISSRADVWVANAKR
jgi:hypothetical protein